MKEIKNICVFSSSSNSLNEAYYRDAELLGELLGKNGFNVVYGGSKLGLMYKVSESFCDEFYLTEGMRERKAKLDEKSDGVIALAGGFGTLEELSEMIVQKQLCYNNKPIVILNTLGFYCDLLKFFEKIIYEKFANKTSENLYYVANTPIDAIEYLKNYKPLDVVDIKEGLISNVLKK